MGPIRLRTKFLLSLLAISAGLTTATLLIVRYSVQKQVRTGIEQDLRNSVDTYESFERQRRGNANPVRRIAGQSAERSRPDDHRDAATIQDGSAEVWRQSGSDLLVMADRSGNVLGLQTNSTGLEHAIVQRSFARLAQEAGGEGLVVRRGPSVRSLDPAHLFRRPFRE